MRVRGSRIGDPDVALAKGDLKFILHGKKLQGKWVLVRMGGKAAREAKPNWLLIKERDEYDQTADETPIVEKAPNSVLTGRDLDAIARDQDHVWQSNPPEPGREPGRKTGPTDPPRAAGARFAPADLAGAKESLPSYIQPQLASEAAAPPTGPQWLHELKLDGYRIQAHIDKTHRVRLFTRSGLDWTHRMATVARALGELSVDSAILDGEVVVLDEQGISSFARLQAAFEEGSTHPLTYFVFDLLHLNGHDLRKQPLTERKQILERMIESLPPQEIVRYGQHLESDGAPILTRRATSARKGSFPNVPTALIPLGRGNHGSRSSVFTGRSLSSGGFTRPANGTDGVGALLLGYYDGKNLMYAGKYRYRIYPGERTRLRKRWRPCDRRKAFTDVPSAAAKGAMWVRPELVAEVRFTTWTKDELVRQASFKGLREDKKATEIRREVADETAAGCGESCGPRHLKESNP